MNNIAITILEKFHILRTHTTLIMQFSLIELRIAKRQAVTWIIFLIIASVVMVTWILNATIDSYLTTDALLNLKSGSISRYETVTNVSILLTAYFILFYIPDYRSRDAKNRIEEVLDSKPTTNFQLIAGRLMGILILGAVLCTVPLLLTYILEYVASLNGNAFFDDTNYLVLVLFTLLEVATILFSWIALIMVVNYAVRSKLITSTLLSFIVFIYWFVLPSVPVDVYDSLSLHSGSVVQSVGDMFQYLGADKVTIKLGWVCLTTSMVFFLSGMDSRHTDIRSRIRYIVISVVLATVGVLLGYGVYWNKTIDDSLLKKWKEVHLSSIDHGGTDIRAIRGVMKIDPGKRMDMNLFVELNGLKNEDGDYWLFTLNPGLLLESVAVDGVPTQKVSFTNGLLRIDIPSTTTRSGTVVLNLNIHGQPDESFGYLHSKIKMGEVTAKTSRVLRNLGDRSYIFDSDVFALMPGVGWLISSGPMLHNDYFSNSSTDFFDIDLEVEVPVGWVVAGPGRMEIENGQENRSIRYRFKPDIAVSALTLVGSKFEKFSTIVDGITFELLVSKDSATSLREMVSLSGPLKEWLRGRLAQMRNFGLEFPFDKLSVVEVPGRLRTYGDGWNMDSTLSAPGVELIRKEAIPFSSLYQMGENLRSVGQLNDSEVGQFLFDSVLAYIQGNTVGLNVFSNVARNFVCFQTIPDGEGYAAVSAIIDELSSMVVLENQKRFSVRDYLHDRENLFQSMTASIVGGVSSTKRFVPSISVWKEILNNSLSDLDYWSDSDAAYYALRHKTRAIASSIIDYYGKGETIAFLAELVRKYRSRSFSAQQFRDTAREVGLDFDNIVGDWLESKTLPGFTLLDKSSVERVNSDVASRRLFRSSFVLNNEEETPGLVKISYYPSADSQDSLKSLMLDPIRIPGFSSQKISVQTDFVPVLVVIEPYLSLNRRELKLILPPPSEAIVSYASEPLVSEIPFKVKFEGSIIVDDLDPTFKIVGEGQFEESDREPWLIDFFVQLFRERFEPELDQGIPLQSEYTLASFQGRWMRVEEPLSVGRYRHTYVQKLGKLVDAQANFSATLPTKGKWVLEYHIPYSVLQPEFGDFLHQVFGISSSTESVLPADHNRVNSDKHQVSTASDGEGSIKNWIYKVSINQGDSDEMIEFDIDTASAGWNTLGSFQLDASKVDVLVDAGSPGVVVADAIKWTLQH